MNIRFTSAERAQVMLELLDRKAPDADAGALKLIRQVSRVPIALEKIGVEAVVDSLPREPNCLRKELRNHLKSMQVGNCDADTHHAIGKVLDLLDNNPDQD
jgi:hypothetical protein